MLYKYVPSQAPDAVSKCLCTVRSARMDIRSGKYDAEALQKRLGEMKEEEEDEEEEEGGGRKDRWCLL
jgi:hypothetical protein